MNDKDVLHPLSDFILKDPNPTKLHYSAVWARVLDKRFCMEVIRLEPYKGEFRIFDGLNNKLIYKEEVSIGFDAIYGVDHTDAVVWSEKGVDVIDNKFKEKK